MIQSEVNYNWDLDIKKRAAAVKEETNQRDFSSKIFLYSFPFIFPFSAELQLHIGGVQVPDRGAVFSYAAMTVSRFIMLIFRLDQLVESPIIE